MTRSASFTPRAAAWRAVASVVAIAAIATLAATSWVAPAPASTGSAVALSATAAKQSGVRGWGSGPVSLQPGQVRTFTLTVTTAPRAARRVAIEARAGGTEVWRRGGWVRSNRQGVVRLSYTAPAAPAWGALRVRVAALRGSPAFVTRQRGLAVIAATPAPTSTPTASPTATPTATPTASPTATPGPSPVDERAEVFALTNQARSGARTCGSAAKPAVPVLTRDARLDSAAQEYAQRMAEERFFDHRAPDGTDPGDRITAEGYVWRAYGENIAAGQTTPSTVMAGWLNSSGHCANIMSASVTQLGVGYVDVPGSPYRRYWVQVFAAPR